MKDLKFTEEQVEKILEDLFQDLKLGIQSSLEPINIYHGWSDKDPSNKDRYFMFSARISGNMLTGIGGLIKFWEMHEINKSIPIKYNGANVLDNKLFIEWVYSLINKNEEE